MPAIMLVSKYLAVGGALALVLGCGSSTPKANGAAGNQGSSGSTSSSGGSEASGGSNTAPTAGAAGAPMLTSSAAAVAAKLGRPAHFLIGLGNDLSNDHSMDGAYTLGPTLDLHYAYLVGLQGQGGWPDWNAGGFFVNILTDTADQKGTTPMFSMWSMAAQGENRTDILTQDSFMKPYLDGVKLMYQRLGAFGKPSVVHLEPDFWAFMELAAKEDPSKVKVNVTANAPDCAGLSNDVAGLGHCMVKLARMYAPKAIIGFHASQWAAGDPRTIVTFMKAVGAADADVVFTDLLDRDAGCFEAKGDGCNRGGGTFYWDETNKTTPNFHEFLSWSTAIASGLGRPMIWWQIPLGVPSTTPGGTPGHYRDNRVHYIFSHIDEFVAAGGLGATFGVGAGGQTYIDSDGGQFKNAVTAYFKNPVAIH